MQMGKLKPRERESDRLFDLSKLNHIPEPYYPHL